MKNNFFYSLVLFCSIFVLEALSQELEINSSKVKYDNLDKVTIFEGDVNSIDEKGNKLFSEYARYNEFDEVIKTTGKTKIITSKGYEVSSSNVVFDNKKKIIKSNYSTQIKDKDGNKITVDMFNYSITNNIFFSKGNIKIFDLNNNNYSFSEIYIDENKKKIIGSDVKAFLNEGNIAKNNDTRFFANTMVLSKNTNTLEKGIFTTCKRRENGKCTPWVLQSEKINHDLAKKTIFYENVVLKIYDFPIFYSPKFSHPDPTVDRRSGLLAPALTNSSTLGSGFSLPYFLNLANDRDLTLTPKIYLNENPLLLGEYRQDFKNSFLFIDAGYTPGYKKKSNTKTDGSRLHFFSKFNMSLIEEDDKNSNLEINLQKATNDTYFKIYDLETSLVDKEKKDLENSINYTYQNEDFYFSLSPSKYEDMTKIGHLRDEYLLPLTVEKNIMSNEKFGFLDLNTNLKIRNYDTNKRTDFLINDFNWKSNKWLNKFGFENSVLGQVKTVNYQAKKTKKFKNNGTNSEIKSALGYFTKLGMYKNDVSNKNIYTLTPKFLLRYAPGHMRNIDSGRLNYSNLYKINKFNDMDVLENGLSTSIGFDFKKNKLDKENNIANEIFSFSAGQVVSADENPDMPSSSSLGQRFSDVVGEAKYNFNNKINLNYNFSIDQGYKNFNYNEISANLKHEKVKFNLTYLQEKNHIGSQEFAQTGVDYSLGDSSKISFSTKRNLLTSSAEFYNLSYNYINDCLKAGIGYRREFYSDRDIEPTNKLMFTISIIPFAEINSPSFK